MDPETNATYGSLSGDMHGAKRNHFKRVNIVGLLAALYLPFIIFCVGAGIMICALVSGMSAQCLALLFGLGLVILLLCLASCAGASKPHGDKDPKGMSWSPFIWTMGIVAFIVAILFGSYVGSDTAETYTNLANLATYKDVDPSRTRGQELMDAGQIVFKNTNTSSARVDKRRAIGFKNIVTYCVAPITIASNTSVSPLQVYDFWAVGRDCCTSESATVDFNCGQANNPTAHAGLRVMRDKDRPFYRLAVRQAEAKYQTKALHPLFFYWVGDPAAELEALKRAAFKSFLSGVFGFFIFQLVVVLIALCCFKRFTPW